jgi:hypothetical protein
MKATELRIGNYVFYNSENDKNEPVRFYDKLDGEDIKQMEEHEHYLGLHEPIPLTPEILEKCGFENGERQINAHNDTIQVCGETVRLWAGSAEGHGVHVLCQSLHQLQNLFFALTGEELEVNLEGL